VTVAAVLGSVLAAAASTSPHAPKGGEGVKSGPIGLAVILVLCVVAYFLFKSMSKHLRKVRDDFPAHAETGSAHRPTASTGRQASPAGEVPSGEVRSGEVPSADAPSADVPPKSESS
jgi:hypothetical protein